MARMERVSIRVEKKVRKKIKQWATKEGLPPAELYRRLFEWGSDQYARAGSLQNLRAGMIEPK
jgi:predicted DNA binding CopG/RHH family protein